MAGPGRPPVGPVVKVRLPSHLLADIDRRAAARGIKRAEMLRLIIDVGLAEI